MNQRETSVVEVEAPGIEPGNVSHQKQHETLQNKANGTASELSGDAVSSLQKPLPSTMSGTVSGTDRPPEMLLQSFLRGGGSPEELRTKYAITHRRHGIHSQLVLFKYNQIESPFAEPIVRECRGVILDEADGWRVVSRAFDKFFNEGEGHAAPIDWSTARVQEKLDGSLCVLYPYAGEWHVATSGTPDASGDVQGSDRFADYFWRTFAAHGWRLPEGTRAAEHCFFFELTGPANRIVVVHAEPSLTLLGARDLVSMAELPVGQAARAFDCNAREVREFPLTSIKEIAASFASMSPLTQEGYVIVDGAFNRIKVKHPGYVALHRAKDGMSQKAFVEIARAGETSEVLTAFPEFKPLLDDAKARLDGLTTEVEADFASLRGIEAQKDFAIRAVKTRCSAALFAVRAGKTSSIRRFFAEMRIESLMQLLGYREAA
ncbi:MAG: RNA ligase [Gemmatimonadota bacterium]